MTCEEIFTKLSEHMIKEVTPLTGYYKVDKKVKVDEGNLLNIGINLLGEYEVPQTITDGIFVANT